MKTIVVDVFEVVLPDRLRREIESECEVCRAARLLLLYCCTRHYYDILNFMEREEASGRFVVLKSDIRRLLAVLEKIRLVRLGKNAKKGNP